MDNREHFPMPRNDQQYNNRSFRNITNSTITPRGSNSIQNLCTYIPSPMMSSVNFRQNEVTSRPLSGSLSSGIGSCPDTVSSELKMNTSFSASNNNGFAYIDIKSASSSLNKTNPPTIQREYTSPSSLLCFTTKKSENKPKQSVIEDSRALNTLDSIWSSDKEVVQTDGQFVSNLDFNDNLFTVDDIFNFQTSIPDHDSINSIPFEFDHYFSVAQNNSTQQNFIEEPNQSWNQSSDQLMNTINLQNIQTRNEINRIRTQSNRQDQLNNSRVIINEVIPDVQNKQFHTGLQTLSPFIQNISFQTLKNTTNPNIIMNLNPNSQIQLASLDSNLVQQLLMNNVGPNYNFVPQFNDMTNIQLNKGILNGNSSIFVNVDNQSSHMNQTIPENVDLMDNPANWRRLPNSGGYQCALCTRTYTRKYGLKIHLRIHSGFKPLECKVCAKKFGDPSNMAKHTRLHSTDESPYKCLLCNKPLVRRRDLERHMRSRHPDSQYNPDSGLK